MSTDKDSKLGSPTDIGFPGADRGPEPGVQGKGGQPGPGLEGQRMGNYVAEGLIGRGGMGSVYLARHPEIGRRVAVKVLSPELASIPQAVERFIAEAKAIATIEHPNVIDIYDFGRMPNGRAYHVMELLKGKELGEVMKRKGRWTPAELLPLLRQICGGLQAAHDEGIVHRDLKPENIFLLDRGPVTVKILDFGIAKILEAQQGPTHTSPGTIIGTPMVIAPEQAAGDIKRVGTWTDIYSLGVIIYWMLSGRPPFVDKTSGVLLAKHILHAPPDLKEVEPSVPRSLAGLVHQCLSKAPEDRPESARKIAQAFAIALGEDPGEPLPGYQKRSTGPHKAGSSEESRGLLPIESATTIGGETGEEEPVTADGVTLLGHTPTIEAPADEPQDTRQTTSGTSAGEVAAGNETLMQLVGAGRRRWLLLAMALAALAAVAFGVWRPTRERDQHFVPAKLRPDAARPDSAGVPPDARVTPDAASPDAAVKPDLSPNNAVRSTPGGKRTPRHPRPKTTPPRSPDSRPAARPKPDAAVKSVKDPKPGPTNVGEGTIDPFGDVKDRKKR